MFSFEKWVPKPPSEKNLPPFNPLMFFLLIGLPLAVIPMFIILNSLLGSWPYYGIMFVTTYALCILAIGIYHRYWTHRSFEFKETFMGKFAERTMRLFGIFFGTLAGQGDVLSWSLRHWKHHLVEDIPGKDHHTPLEFKNKFKGFIWSHVGWMCYINPSDFDFASHSKNKRVELEKDKLVKWQHKHYVLLYIFSTVFLPLIIGCILSPDFWFMIQGVNYNLGALLIHLSLTFLSVNAARMACQHATFLVNSLCHISGSSPYQNHKTGQAKDNWLVAILVFGEGFHNGHHAFGYSYEHGIIHSGNKKTWRAKLMYALDIHARLIDLFGKMGLLKYKLKPTDNEVALVQQKTLMFELEEKFETLTLEFQQKKTALKTQISQEIEDIKSKLTETSFEYEAALKELILKLKSLIEIFQQKIADFQKNQFDLRSIWQSKLEKAKKELNQYENRLLKLQAAS